MKITDIKIRKIFEDSSVKAILSITLDDVMAIHDVKIISNNEKTFVSMPSKKINNGNYISLAHPTNSNFRKYLEREILNEYKKYTSNFA